MEQQTDSKSGKEYVKAVYCHHAYFTYMQSTSCEMLGWIKHRLESNLQGETSITSDTQMTPPLWQKVKSQKVSWWKWESKKVGLKLTSQKTKIMASSPISSVSVQSFSHVQLFVTAWIAACQASLSITNSQCLLKLMSIELVMPSNHLIFCHPVLLPTSIFPSIWVFFNESVLRIRWPKYWGFSFSHQSFQWIFRTDFL